MKWADPSPGYDTSKVQFIKFQYSYTDWIYIWTIPSKLVHTDYQITIVQNWYLCTSTNTGSMHGLRLMFDSRSNQIKDNISELTFSAKTATPTTKQNFPKFVHNHFTLLKIIIIGTSFQNMKQVCSRPLIIHISIH